MKLDILDAHSKKITISDQSSIRDAIKLIQANSERVCFVVDKRKVMLSSVSDGDVRRGLIKGYKLSDKVKKILSFTAKGIPQRGMFGLKDPNFFASACKLSKLERLIKIFGSLIILILLKISLITSSGDNPLL